MSGVSGVSEWSERVSERVSEWRRGRGGRREGRTDAGGMAANKTRTPHRDVGKNNAGPSVFGARAAMDDVLLCLPCATPSPPKKW